MSINNIGYTEVIMNQKNAILFGTEADLVDNSILCIYRLRLQLVAQASPVFHKDTTIWNSIRFNLGVQLRPMMKKCIL